MLDSNELLDATDVEINRKVQDFVWILISSTEKLCQYRTNYYFESYRLGELMNLLYQISYWPWEMSPNVEFPEAFQETN